ncbi:MAG: hypothetical protein ACM3NP_14240 [Actinomycetota bacterium]
MKAVMANAEARTTAPAVSGAEGNNLPAAMIIIKAITYNARRRK